MFNAWIGDDRKKTILVMLQSIMNRFMVTFQKRYEKESTTYYMVTPKVKVLKEHNKTFLNWFKDTIFGDDNASETLRKLEYEFIAILLDLE